METILRRPHFLNPKKETIRVIFLYKNFAAIKGIYHIGLGVAASNTAKTLLQNGYWAQVEPMRVISDIPVIIDRIQQEAILQHKTLISHIVLSAPWIPTTEMAQLINRYPEIQFVSVCHSNVGFLFADTNGVKNLRGYIELQTDAHNFHVAGNCERFQAWIRHSFNTQCLWLPNLYYIHDNTGILSRIHYQGGKLRIGCFGATRPLKNLMTAAAAALEISQRLNCDLEFWTSGGRTETGANGIKNSVHAMLENINGVEEHEVLWQPWPAFKNTVKHMNLLLQPSYTESFNMVTADGISMGVPSVVSDAITWTPKSWIVSADDPSAIANIGVSHLHNPHCAQEGMESLTRYVSYGLLQWENYLLNNCN